MLTKPKLITAVIINALTALITTGIVISYFFEQPSVLMKHGYETFRFFTTDSNILAALAALVMLWFEVKILRKKRTSLPKWAVVLKFMGTVSVMLTLLTVLAFLVPIYGPELVLGTYAHVHVGAPLMALVTFVFLETEHSMRLHEVLLGIFPMFVYGCVYMTEVVVIGEANGGWSDFYQFNQNGMWYITILMMLVGTLIISLLTAAAHNLRLHGSSEAEPADTKE